MTLREELEDIGLTSAQIAFALTREPAEVEHLVAKARQPTVRNRAAYIAASLNNLPTPGERSTPSRRNEDSPGWTVTVADEITLRVASEAAAAKCVQLLQRYNVPVASSFTGDSTQFVPAEADPNDTPF